MKCFIIYLKLCFFSLFTEINKENPDSSEMEFFEDGNWEPRNDHEERKEEPCIVQPIGLDGTLTLQFYIFFPIIVTISTYQPFAYDKLVHQFY